jgi:hypothetical protein
MLIDAFFEHVSVRRYEDDSLVHALEWEEGIISRMMRIEMRKYLNNSFGKKTERRSLACATKFI